MVKLSNNRKKNIAALRLMLDKEFARQTIRFDKMTREQLIGHCRALHSNFTVNCDNICKLRIENTYLKDKLEKAGIKYE